MTPWRLGRPLPRREPTHPARRPAHAGPARLPRHVWTYWHQGWPAAPEIVKRCAESWRRTNPGWRVHMLDAASEEARAVLPPAADVVEPALPARSDLLRLALLERHGGVWADATLWCARPLDAWIDDATAPTGFFAYTQPTRDRPADNWFLAAAPGSRIISRWRSEALAVLAKTEARAARRGRARSVLLHRLGLFGERVAARWTHLRFRHGYGLPWGRPYDKLLLPTAEHPKLGVYYWVHYLFRQLLESDEEFRRAWAATPKIAADGPLRLLRAGLLAPHPPETGALVERDAPHVVKLTYKTDLPDDLRGTALGALLATARR